MITNAIHVPHLTAQEYERLAYLAEELAEAGAAIGKILRHGYNSYDPTNPNVEIDPDGDAHPNNRSDLHTECGHVLAALQMMINSRDIYNIDLHIAKDKKLASVKKWMHYQADYVFQKGDL